MAMQENPLVATIKRTILSFVQTGNKLAVLFSERFGPFPKLSCDEQKEFEKLKSKLDQIRSELKAAEEKIGSEYVPALWLREMRDLELRAQDVVEEVDLRLHRSGELEQLKTDLLCSNSVKRKREADRFCSFLPSMGSLSFKMRKIQNLYDEIASDRKTYALTDAEGEEIPKSSSVHLTSSSHGGELHGRDEDIKNVIKMLFPDDSKPGTNYSVITILGMSGVGKTSLIQHVCNDMRVKSEFDHQIWVQDSKFDLHGLTRQIGQGMLYESSNSSGSDSTRREINRHANKNKFLLVLDDVRIENIKNWDTLMAPLMRRSSGSKAIVMTTNLEVAKKCNKDKIYRLNCLSDDDCWSVCKELIENKDGPKLESHMESVGKSIIVKCKGLPLAARAVGVILIYKINEEHWNNVLENDLWIDWDTCNGFLSALKISYGYLSVPLKRYFTYCSLFPKDHIFQRDQMVRLWMAHDFIAPAPNLEILGRKYYDELVAKCFFQPAPFHDITEGSYKMHDLYHELAQHVSAKECSRTEDHTFPYWGDHIRHSSLVPHETDRDNTMEFSSYKGQYIRTFLFLGNMEYGSDGVPFYMRIPPDLFLKFLCLRVLDLSNTNMEELSDSIGNLFHLRYLGLENTRIESLPETISYLFNLLVMNLSNCHRLIELPKGTKLLSSLRHLNIPRNGSSNIWMPRGIGQLSGLRSLNIFVVGADDFGCQIQELENLNNLSGELSIMDIHQVMDVQSVERAKLMDKARLQKLTMQWSNTDMSETNTESVDSKKINPESEVRVLERLQPHKNLKELVIKGFSGSRLASWLGGPYLSNLLFLDLKDCANNGELPSLGRLPSLKHLGIYSMPRLVRVGREFCGYVGESSSSSNTNSKGFPNLKTLKFQKMDALEEWGGVSSEDFPSLDYLVLDRCPKLRVIPQINRMFYLRDCKHLRVHDCEQLQSFPGLHMDNRAKNLQKAHEPLYC